MTHIPGIVSGQSNISDFETQFLMNFENGDGATPSNDDTGKRSIYWNAPGSLDITVQNNFSKFGNGSIQGLNTDGPYISTEITSNFSLSTKDFCFEAFIYDGTSSSWSGGNVDVIGFFDNDLGSSTDHLYIEYVDIGDNQFNLKINRKIGASTTSAQTSTALNGSTWYHVALTGDASGNYRLFVGGVLEASLLDSTPLTSNSYRARLSTGGSSSCIDSTRVVINTKVYSDSGFTPPSSALGVMGN